LKDENDYGFLVAFGAGLADFIVDFEDFIVDFEDFIEDFIDDVDLAVPLLVVFADALVAVFGGGLALVAAIAVPVIRNPAASRAASIFFTGAPPFVAQVGMTRDQNPRIVHATSE
jgi:hypothetical protein